MNIPNILTLFRLFLIPVFVIVFFSTLPLKYSILIFLIAGFTDILDGYIARRYNLITKWGIVLDPLADKLMLLTVLACLVIKHYIPVLVLIIIACKEIFMIMSGILLYTNGTVIPSNVYGKLASLLFYISIFILMFNEQLGIYMLYISVVSSIIALVNYFVVYYKNKSAN